MKTYDEFIQAPMRVSGNVWEQYRMIMQFPKPKSVGCMTHILGPYGGRLFTVYVGGDT